MKKLNKWLGSEILYLKENYGFLTMEKLCAKIPRHTACGIRNKAKSLGLARKRVPPEEYHNPKYKNMSISRQAIAMGMSYDAVYRELIMKKRGKVLLKNK